MKAETLSVLRTSKSTKRQWEELVSGKSCAICKTSLCLFPKQWQPRFWKGSIHEVARRMPHRLKRRTGERREYTFSLPLLAQWSSTVNTKATVCQCAGESNQLPKWQRSPKSASHRKHGPVNNAMDQNTGRHVSMEGGICHWKYIKKLNLLHQNNKKIWKYWQNNHNSGFTFMDQLWIRLPYSCSTNSQHCVL